MRVLVSEFPNNTGKEITVAGWIHKIRKLGGISFVSLRDRSGIAQIVVEKEAHELLLDISTESVVEFTGKIKKEERAPFGAEMLARKARVLNKSKTPPFEIRDTSQINEETRLKYRYLDLRSERMRKNIVTRHKLIKSIRDFLDNLDFTEIETPILTKSTPEGARDYLVPSRKHKGKFFALPQAPQQYKQLLMVAGMERYFQIARCFRDEDQRGDRQPEFTQLDIEMSFENEKEIRDIVENMLIESISKIEGKKFTFNPFKVMTYDEAIKNHRTDRPDLRKNKKDINELAFVWIVDWPMFEYDSKENKYDPHHHIFTSPKEEDIDLLDKDPKKVRSLQYDLVLNGNEIGGGSIRIHSKDLQEKIFKLVGIEKDEAIEKFGHMLTSFEYGAPPHGGIALGIDRLMMILAGESSIREVIAFPKNKEAREVTVGAPQNADPSQLKELGIEFKKKKF